jgi:hypothetical protein
MFPDEPSEENCTVSGHGPLVGSAEAIATGEARALMLETRISATGMESAASNFSIRFFIGDLLLTTVGRLPPGYVSFRVDSQKLYSGEHWQCPRLVQSTFDPLPPP